MNGSTRGLPIHHEAGFGIRKEGPSAVRHSMPTAAPSANKHRFSCGIRGVDSRPRISRRILAVTACVCVAATLSPPSASAAEEYNEYSLIGLPHFVTGPTAFSVAVDGPDAVCRMEFDGQALSAPPWEFTFTPRLTGNRRNVTATLCTPDPDWGDSDLIAAESHFPFEVVSTLVAGNPQVYRGESRPTSQEIEVRNFTETPVQVAVTDKKGRVIASGPAAARSGMRWDDMAKISIPVKGITSTTSYTVTVTGADGLTMAIPLTLTYGWATMTGRAIWRPCANITWSYDATGQPRSASSFKKDVVSSLSRITKVTGLTFAEVPAARIPADRYGTDESAAVGLRYKWRNLGKHGPSGTGGTDGAVTINNADWWPNNSNAGFGVNRGVPGRGWLIVHETMHTMGFAHVEDRTQVMNPIGYSHSFGTGDLQGLRALYPKAGCKSS